MTVASPIIADGTVECDFLIVGAGSSGCVLASRLVRAGLKVLLVEKGPTDASTLAKMVGRPSGWVPQASSGKGVSEAFNTVPQAGLAHRQLPAYSGLGGGGTSNVNAGLYQRGRCVCLPMHRTETNEQTHRTAWRKVLTVHFFSDSGSKRTK